MLRRPFATSIPFRIVVVLLCLAFHLEAFLTLTRERMQAPWNADPQNPPAFDTQDNPNPSRWNRLIFSRWDAQHYVDILERGYSRCPPEDLRGASLQRPMYHCRFNFYPGYPMIGRAVKLVFHVAPDFALLAVSLVSSFLFLFLWTGPTLTKRLGVGTTYLSLFFFNIFPGTFVLTAIQTEPVALLSLLASFACLQRRWWLLGAAIAGVGGAIRVSGGPIGAAYGIALLVNAIRERDEKWWIRWGRLAIAAPLCGWGQLVIFGYFYSKYHDPLLYVHAHSQSYHHGVDLWHTFFPSPAIVAKALLGLHDALFVAVALFFLALGGRRAFAAFPPVERAYFLACTILVMAVSLVGSAGLAYAGMSRYMLLVLPVFFSMAMTLRGRWAGIAVWSVCSLWHYWNVDLCVFVAQWETPKYCNMRETP